MTQRDNSAEFQKALNDLDSIDRNRRNADDFADLVANGNSFGEINEEAKRDVTADNIEDFAHILANIIQHNGGNEEFTTDTLEYYLGVQQHNVLDIHIKPQYTQWEAILKPLHLNDNELPINIFVRQLCNFINDSFIDSTEAFEYVSSHVNWDKPIKDTSITKALANNIERSGIVYYDRNLFQLLLDEDTHIKLANVLKPATINDVYTYIKTKTKYDGKPYYDEDM